MHGRIALKSILAGLALLAAPGIVDPASAQTYAAACPPSYPLHVRVPQKVDNVVTVALEMEPTQELKYQVGSSRGRYASKRTEEFKLSSGSPNVHRMYWLTYEAQCKSWPGGPIAVALTGVAGTVTWQSWSVVRVESRAGECDPGDNHPDESEPTFGEPSPEECSSGGSEGGGDGGGGGDGAGSGGSGTVECTDNYIYVEVYNDQTGEWEVWWEGWATVC